MNNLLKAGMESLSIPRDALRLALRHAPALISVLCVALGLRSAVLWLAVVVSDHSPFAATLLVPFAPLAVMCGLIIALWIMQPSLPFLSNAIKTPGSYLNTTRLLTIGGLLIPFLTVYSSNGLLKEDVRSFIYDATLDESVNNFLFTDFSRVIIDDTRLTLILIITVLLIRKAIGYFGLGERGFGFASLSAYLETLWMVTLSAMLTTNVDKFQEWLMTRAVVAPAYHNFLEAKAIVIENAGLLGKAYVAAGTIAGKLDDVIVVPLAWLTLGAVLFGTTLAPKATSSASDSPTKGSPRHAKRSRRAMRVTTAQARELLDTAAQPIAGPIKLAWQGVQKLAVAGIVPMIVFCLIFILCSLAELGTVYAARAIIGPQPLLKSAALWPYVSNVARLAYFFVALPLLAAAVDRYLRHSYADDAAQTAEDKLVNA
ncbi:hypothetical protein [Corynebacterium epidermidicanis]|uniref:hypothetical protein n=1 Tax=Corynebacterium epidermidicanis TaxID=1050174 RepID=UPI0011875E59|nr:hypothetical protein [Corynebacterium epidermidicanis]